MSRLWAVVLVVLLSGCAAPAEVGPTQTEDAAVADATIDAPDWQVGQWWRYDFGGQSITWIVTEDLTTDWWLSVDDADLAFEHEVFSQVSTIGAVSKKHLDGSQEDGAVRFFDFPLQQGKTWSTTWDGDGWRMEVLDLVPATEHVPATAEIHATADDGTLRVYIYDERSGWFKSMRAFDEEGNEEFAVALEQHGVDYGGTYVRWTLHDDQVFLVSPGAPAQVQTFDVPEEATGVWVMVVAWCSDEGLEGDQGAGLLEIHPESGSTGLSHHHICPSVVHAQEELDPHAGSWGITVGSAGASIHARVVPRTLDELRLA